MNRLASGDGHVIRLVPASAEVARGVLDGAVPTALRHVPDWPHPDTADALRGLAEHAELSGEGTFLVERDGTVVGECGWFGPADADGEVEIGYGLAVSARRQGVGTAAVTLLLEWVAAHGARRVRAEVLPGNEASLRLLVGLGFVVQAHREERLVLIRDLRPADR